MSEVTISATKSYQHSNDLKAHYKIGYDSKKVNISLIKLLVGADKNKYMTRWGPIWDGSQIMIKHHIVSNAVYVELSRCKKNIIFRYNGNEQNMPIIKLFIYASAILQRRKWLDEVQ